MNFLNVFLYIITNNFLAIFAFDSNCIRLIIFVIPNTYDKHIKTFNKYSGRYVVGSFILYPVFSITPWNSNRINLSQLFCGQYSSLSQQSITLFPRKFYNTGFHISLVFCLVHIRLSLIHQCSMVNINESILCLLSEEIRKRNFLILIYFWCKFSKTLLLK